MRSVRILLFLLDITLIFLQLSCSAFSYPPLDKVTEIVVKDQNQVLNRITYPVEIAEVVKFVDDQRHGWYAPALDVPSPRITLGFYNKAQYLGAFGVGKNFFYTQREGKFDAKSATDKDIKRFLDLVKVEASLIDGKGN
jgi:hypothetical protein